MNRYLPLALIIGLLIAFRVVGYMFPQTLPNFQPLAAVFFCGAMLAPGWRGLAIPLGVWLVTLPLDHGYKATPLEIATTFSAFAMIFLFGKALSGQSFARLLGGSVVSAVTFHLLTCLASWYSQDCYAKNLEGLYQSIWAGPINSPLPSWVFLRNLTAGNVLFTAVFLAAQVRLPKVATPVLAFAKSR